MKSDFKKLDTRGHFTDFWHRASSWRHNKKIGARRERRLLNNEKQGRLIPLLLEEHIQSFLDNP